MLKKGYKYIINMLLKLLKIGKINQKRKQKKLKSANKVFTSEIKRCNKLENNKNKLIDDYLILNI